MKSKRVLTSVLAVALLLALTVGLTQAQGPEPPEGEVSIEGGIGTTAAVGGKIPVQGRLTDASGSPLDGTYTINFYLYDALTGGNLVCDDDVNNDVPVSTGLFTWEIWGDCGADDLTGLQLYLEIRVEGETLSPRRPIYPVPYAWSLRPGAHVVGSVTASPGAALYVRNEDTSHSTIGISGETNSSSDWSSGVFGKATAESGVTTGVYGWDASTEGRGVMGAARATSGETYGVKGESNSPDGYGGYFENKATSGVAYGVCGKSDSSTGVRGEGPRTGVRGYAFASSGSAYGIAGTSYSTSGHGVSGLALSTSGPTRGVYGESRSPDGHAGHFFNTSSGVALYARTDSGTGNIIEAWSSPTDREFRVERDGDVYADGDFHSGGGDLAEMLPAVGGLEAGDVLAVGLDGKLIRSTTAYQPTVVGVYSTAPGFVGGSSDDVDLTDKIPLAVVGVAPVKVSAENGPIAPGDLLVASATPGHAMKASPNPPIGTVIGKALEGLDDGTGVILVLVMLQ